MGPETKFTILLYQYCKWNARRTHPKEGLRAFAFLISVYKTAGLGCTLGHQIMSCILPLGRGIGIHQSVSKLTVYLCMVACRSRLVKSGTG